MELYALQEVVSEFEQANATLVALSPQLEEHNHSMVENHDLAFDILTDPGNEYAAKLGLRFEIPDNIAEIYRGFGINLPECNGEDSWTLPIRIPAASSARSDATGLSHSPAWWQVS